MTFLAPAAGLIAAAIAVPALIALYLLKLRRRPLKVSSTLLWDQAVQDVQANVPLRWLRASWPLALQLAALAGLLIAIARPAITADSSVASRVVIVIDRSASMSATDGQPPTAPGEPPRTRLDQAKAAANRAVDDLRRATGPSGTRPEAMVIALSADARSLTGFTSDARELRDAIESIGPSDQPGDLGAALQLVRAAAARGTTEDVSPNANPTTDVLLFSDGSFEPGSRGGLPAGVTIRPVRCGHDPGDEPARLRPDNLGIVAINARRDAEAPATVRVFVRVQNSGPDEITTALRCTVDSQTAGGGVLPLTIPGAKVSKEGVFTPGDAAGTIELSRPESGLIVVSISRPDVLPADNTAALLLSTVSKPRILVVGPGQIADDPYNSVRGERGVDRLLLGVLEELDLAELRVTDIAGYEAEAGASGADGAGAWRRFALVIFDRVSPRRAPMQPSISIGATTPGSGITVSPLTAEEAKSAGTRFIAWRRTHAVLRAIPLDAVFISPPMRMTLPPDDTGTPTDAAPSKPTITPLAFGIGGPLIALVKEQGATGAKRLVLAMDLLHTNWGKDVSFPVFIATAVEYLAGRGESAAGRFVTTSEPVSVAVKPGQTQVVVSGPASMRVDAAMGEDGATASAALGMLEKTGIYRVDGAAERDTLITVNLLDPRESALQVERAIDVGGRARPLPTAEFAASQADREGRREIWHWFVLAATAFLTVEWFVYAWRVKV